MRKPEIARKNSIAKTGKKLPPRSDEYRKKMSLAKMGSLNGNWKGGITSETRKIRTSKEYLVWKKAVKERDNYACVWCGRKENLQVDHIKPFALYPELRFAIDNGRTLCVECHKTTETWGKCKHA